MRYFFSFINLINEINKSNLSYVSKISKIFTIIASSNSTTSFLIGWPIIIIFFITFRVNFICKFLYKSSLLHIPIRVLPENVYYLLRKMIRSSLVEVKLDYKKFDQNNLAAELKLNGFLKLNKRLSLESILTIKELLVDSPAYSAQVAAQGRRDIFSNLVKDNVFISHDICDEKVFESAKVVLDEISLTFFLEKLNIKDALIYSINFYWSIFHQSKKLHAVQKFHRDYDGYNCYVLFIALSETNANDGATEIVSLDGSTHFLESQPGEIYLIDPYCKHRANVNIINNRLACWIRFGEVPNLAYNQDLNFINNRRKILTIINNKYIKNR